mmetsp:Transcript_35035/g.84568  ORF Transcript_35035/g.84568 Transcript_35035/m.84568 type:complete len:114 (+) Transcript_35035:173-514(+)
MKAKDSEKTVSKYSKQQQCDNNRLILRSNSWENILGKKYLCDLVELLAAKCCAVSSNNSCRLAHISHPILLHASHSLISYQKLPPNTRSNFISRYSWRACWMCHLRQGPLHEQ